MYYENIYHIQNIVIILPNQITKMANLHWKYLFGIIKLFDQFGLQIFEYAVYI